LRWTSSTTPFEGAADDVERRRLKAEAADRSDVEVLLGLEGGPKVELLEVSVDRTAVDAPDDVAKGLEKIADV